MSLPRVGYGLTSKFQVYQPEKTLVSTDIANMASSSVTKKKHFTTWTLGNVVDGDDDAERSHQPEFRREAAA